MSDPCNMLSEAEKVASQKLWDERMAVINATRTDAISDNLKHVWLEGKLVDDMLNSPRAYGNRSIQEVAADLKCDEEQIVRLRKFYEEFDEAAVDDLAQSGLSVSQAFALLQFSDPTERANVKQRLAARKMDLRQALEEAGRSKARKKAQLRKQREQEYERKRQEDLANDPCGFIVHTFKGCVTQLSDTARVLEHACHADKSFRANMAKMGFNHRLSILTSRHLSVEVIGYFSAKFAETANRIADTHPGVLPNAQPILPLPALTATETINLWRDLHSCPVQLPTKKLGKGFTVICKDLEAFRLFAPSTVERLASIEWALKLMPKMPPGDGLQKCIQALMALHHALCNFQHMLLKFRAKLTQ